MIDICPMNEVRWKVLNYAHYRLDKMDREGIDLIDLVISLKEEIYKKYGNNTSNTYQGSF